MVSGRRKIAHMRVRKLVLETSLVMVYAKGARVKSNDTAHPKMQPTCAHATSGFLSAGVCKIPISNRKIVIKRIPVELLESSGY